MDYQYSWETYIEEIMNPILEKHADYIIEAQRIYNEINSNEVNFYTGEQWSSEQISQMTPLPDIYKIQEEAREKAGIEKNCQCHDEVTFEEWQKKIAKIFDSYRIY